MVGDLALSAALIAVAVAALVGAVDMPPPLFETFGAAPVPRAAAMLLIATSVLIGGRAVLRHSRNGATMPVQLGWVDGARVLATFAVLLFQAAAITYAGLGFVAATLPAMMLLFLILGGVRSRHLLVGAILSVSIPPLLFVFFSRLFQIDLP